ncbi:MAG: hypothetical protein A2235_00110 [Deltaproteobacteria bacterium RIFOXYA2_FULL_42_10]|nr:MAG: hypothetical protein A2235_00110 [Deltaproteobacteria bacterium RIFOXYA2_FULL_42_10]
MLIFKGSFQNNRIGIKEIDVMNNLQKTSVSDGRVLAIAFAETQLPPQIIIEITIKKLNRLVLFESLIG